MMIRFWSVLLTGAVMMAAIGEAAKRFYTSCPRRVDQAARHCLRDYKKCTRHLQRQPLFYAQVETYESIQQCCQKREEAYNCIDSLSRFCGPQESAAVAAAEEGLVQLRALCTQSSQEVLTENYLKVEMCLRRMAEDSLIEHGQENICLSFLEQLRRGDIRKAFDSAKTHLVRPVCKTAVSFVRCIERLTQLSNCGSDAEQVARQLTEATLALRHGVEMETIYEQCDRDIYVAVDPSSGSYGADVQSVDSIRRPRYAYGKNSANYQGLSTVLSITIVLSFLYCFSNF